MWAEAGVRGRDETGERMGEKGEGRWRGEEDGEMGYGREGREKMGEEGVWERGERLGRMRRH